ncbi:MAG TPA: sulfite reductase subunit alpha [Candidatus Limnocylindrales bacterium]|nr:sulfite reductase subunit alpha [Candidatus Limnocylindrales bacterium]
MNPVPFIPETAPFTLEQRAWLNGFLAGLHSSTPADTAPAAPKNSEPLLILFGSQTGSAEGLAKKVAKESQQRGFAPKVLALNDYEAANLAAVNKAVIISSTWGDGEPPDNAVNFWNWLNTESAPRLENLQFAILGLGDKNYSDFCGASKKFDARLEALGAKRLVPRGECDVDYETTAKSWIDSLWEKLVGQASSLSSSSAASDTWNGSAHTNGSLDTTSTGKMPVPPLFDKSNPFPARLLKNVLLNQPSSSKEVRHYEISLAGSGLAYEAGDALGVVPVNCPELVDDLLAALKCHGDEPVKIDETEVPLREALTRHYEITKPTQELIAVVGERGFANGLSPLLAPDRRDDLKRWIFGRDVLDVLGLLPVPMPLAELLPLLRKLSPRLYSISSSPKAHPGEVHLTVSSVRYESHGRPRKGVASTFLADRVGDTEFVKVFVQQSHGFRPPVNGDAPMIMVGPGTGIAPFRAFLEKRQTTGAKGKNWLFFGDQTRTADFLYEEQLTAWRKNNFLTRLDLAFSRDQAEKIYVQDRLIENALELWSWLEAGAHFYVCGDASRMAKDVDAALHKVIETAGGKNPDEAKAYVGKLISDKRYQRDVY